MASSVVVDPDDVQHDQPQFDNSAQHHTVSASPSSIANSPTPFSFSPVRYSASQDKCYAHYSVSSYGTDITSVIGSWEPDHDQTVAPVREDKGKAVDRQHCLIDPEEEDPPQPSSKGKGKAILTHHASFEFDFEPYDTEPSLETASINSAGVSSNPFAGSSVMQHLNLDPANVVYPGPSSRNGSILTNTPLEDRAEAALSEPPSLSSTRPPSSLDDALACSEATHDLAHSSHPIHKRSFSSLSMRSIRSSSSRSLASIRSKFTPDNLKAKAK